MARGRSPCDTDLVELVRDFIFSSSDTGLLQDDVHTHHLSG